MSSEEKKRTTSTTNTQDKANREYCSTSSDKHRWRERETVEKKNGDNEK